MAKSQELSYDTKTILVVLLLIFAFPVGVILMWMWMNWPKWVKFLLTLPFLLIPLFIIMGIAFTIFAVMVGLKSEEAKHQMQKQIQQEQTIITPYTTPINGE